MQKLAAVEIGEAGNESRERMTNTKVERAVLNRRRLKRSRNILQMEIDVGKGARCGTNDICNQRLNFSRWNHAHHAG